MVLTELYEDSTRSSLLAGRRGANARSAFCSGARFPGPCPGIVRYIQAGSSRSNSLPASVGSASRCKVGFPALGWSARSRSYAGDLWGGADRGSGRLECW